MTAKVKIPSGGPPVPNMTSVTERPCLIRSRPPLHDDPRMASAMHLSIDDDVAESTHKRTRNLLANLANTDYTFRRSSRVREGVRQQDLRTWKHICLNSSRLSMFVCTCAIYNNNVTSFARELEQEMMTRGTKKEETKKPIWEQGTTDGRKNRQME